MHKALLYAINPYDYYGSYGRQLVEQVAMGWRTHASLREQYRMGSSLLEEYNRAMAEIRFKFLHVPQEVEHLMLFDDFMRGRNVQYLINMYGWSVQHVRSIIRRELCKAGIKGRIRLQTRRKPCRIHVEEDAAGNAVLNYRRK